MVRVRKQQEPSATGRATSVQTMALSTKRLASHAAVAGLFVATNPALAGVYQALCSGGSECSVTLANGQIAMPGLVIQKDQVLSWSQGGSGSKTWHSRTMCRPTSS